MVTQLLEKCNYSIQERIINNHPAHIHLVFHFLQILYIGLYTAWVNDESKKPLEILNSVPSANYNNAVQKIVLCTYKRVGAFRFVADKNVCGSYFF